MAQNGIQYWGLSWTVLLVIMYLSMGQAQLTTNCMKCICEVEGCENNLYSCNPDEGSLSCGPYQIKRPYYTDCKRPGMINNYQGCTKTMKCSETCVKAYMQRYGLYCTRGEIPTCENYARIHNGGPTGCRHQSNPETETKLRTYWEKVKQCCRRDGGC